MLWFEASKLKKTKLWEVKMIHCSFFFSKNEKVNIQYLILLNATKLKCLYIEMQEFEVKTTALQGKKRGTVCPH